MESAGLSENIRFAPKEICSADDPRPTIFFAGIEENQIITESPFDIYAVVDVASGFKDFRIQYGIGEDPDKWIPLADPFDSTRPQPDRLVTWDMAEISGNLVTVRIVVNGKDENYSEKRIHLILDVPAPTPLPTLTASITPVPTETPTPTCNGNTPHRDRNFGTDG